MSDDGGFTAEPPEVTDLRTRSVQVRELLADIAEKEPDDVRLAVGLPGLVSELRRIEPVAQRAAYVLQPRYYYDPEDPGVALVRKAAARGVVTHLVTPPATVTTHPLLSSIFPTARLAPVFLRAMVVDEHELLLGGWDTADGERTVWCTTRPDVLEAVLDVWHRTIALSTPVLPPDTPPPLSPRQLEVARLVAVGEKDVSIARLLEMSARTVERDVRAVLQSLGAGSRTEAVLLMRGRGVNGGSVGDL